MRLCRCFALPWLLFYLGASNTSVVSCIINIVEGIRAIITTITVRVTTVTRLRETFNPGHDGHPRREAEREAAWLSLRRATRTCSGGTEPRLRRESLRTINPFYLADKSIAFDWFR